MVHSLIESYRLLENMVIIPCELADDGVLSGFHSQDYLKCLKESGDEDGDEEYGLGASEITILTAF